MSVEALTVELLAAAMASAVADREGNTILGFRKKKRGRIWGGGGVSKFSWEILKGIRIGLKKRKEKNFNK